jgi:methylmalonyl-CoA mutase cobalamin-binding domain/chain
MTDPARRQDVDDVLVVVGGIIPGADVPVLEADGIGRGFRLGSGLGESADSITSRARPGPTGLVVRRRARTAG